MVRINAYGITADIGPLILNLGTGGSVVSFTPWLHCLQRTFASFHWIGGWVGLISAVDAFENTQT